MSTSGSSGAVGPAGPSGQAGASGPQGIQGVAGAVGAAGAAGSAGAAGATGAAGPSVLPANVVVPLSAGSPVPATAIALGSQFKAMFARCIVGKSGVLHDVSVFNGGTLGGNTNVAVFDTGDSVAGKYSPLWSSGSVAQAGVNVWQVVGDPNIAVTAGQHLLLAAMTDSVLATFSPVALSAGTAAGSQLPASFMPVSGGALPKLAGSFTYGSLVYAQITEAQLVAVTSPLLVVGRIV